MRFVIALMLMILVSCKPPAPPAAPPEKAKVVYTIGGLGDSCMGAISDDLSDSWPVVDFGTPNAYLADVAGFSTTHSHGKMGWIGHSYGGDKVGRTWKAGKPDFIILLDPVATVGHSTIDVRGVKTYVVWAKQEILDRVNIVGPYEYNYLRVGHSDLPKDPRCVKIVHDIVEKEMNK